MSDCRRHVETAIRRHRALSGKPFPEGECGQLDCIHVLVKTLIEHDPLCPLGERSCDCIGIGR